METKDIWTMFVVALLLTIVTFDRTAVPIEQYEEEVQEPYKGVMRAETPEEFSSAMSEFISGLLNFSDSEDVLPALIMLRENVNETNLAESQQAVAGLYSDTTMSSGWWALRIAVAIVLIIIFFWALLLQIFSD
jgi:hypothetical protein